MAIVIRGIPTVPGQVSGQVLASDESLSFWGGYNLHTGEITDRRHPLSGQIGRGKILALPYSRGSSTTSAVLLEAVREGTQPAAIITTGEDPFFALASITAAELYGRDFPVIAVSPADFEKIMHARSASIQRDGSIELS